MSGAKSDKPLKDQNRWQLWLTIAANCVALYGVSQAERLADLGLKAMLTGAPNLLPVSLALVVTSVANGLVTADMKARLVALRWRHPLPGHRAFSEHATKDPRVDVARLTKALGNKVPSDPDEQNRTWYRLYKEVENDPAVLHVHREFLFTRDYTALAALFLVLFGGASAVAVRPWSAWGLYLLCLVLQFAVARQAASTYGRRFVCTVLARKGSMPTRTKPKA